MSQPQNTITNTSEEKEKILTQCTSFLSNHLNPLNNDLSYNEIVSKDENLKIICKVFEINIKSNDNSTKSIEESFSNHDIKCEFLLLRYITEDDKHRKKLIKFINPAINKLNRYSTVIPYEYNSVPVCKDKKQRDINNYINASFISGPFGITLIAAQNPMENTINSFWLMIINHNISLIVLLSYTFEESNDKFIQYWPKEKEKPLSVIEPSSNKKYTIKLTAEINVIEKYVPMRTFDICEGDKVILTVKQYQFNFWEDQSIPLAQIGIPIFDTLTSLISDEYKQTKCPTLVECSDGIGRTGTFIGLFSLIKCLQEQKRAKVENPVLNIFNVIRKLREERDGMVSNANQYKFIYDCCRSWITKFY